MNTMYRRELEPISSPAKAFVYLDGARRVEEVELANMGAQTLRISTREALIRDAFRKFENSGVIVRAERMPLNLIRRVYENISTHCCLIDNMHSIQIMSDISKWSTILRRWSPGTIVVKRGSSAEKIVQAINDENLKPPFFIRTDVESVAKYLGSAACIVEYANDKEIDRIIRNIDSHIKEYSELQIKEVVNIDPSTEQRFVSMGGNLVCDDLNELPWDVAQQALAIAHVIGMVGIDGFAMFDLARAKDDKVVLVEAKPGYYGSVNSARALFSKQN